MIISKFINDNLELSFSHVLKMIKYLYPHKELEMMKSYMEGIKRKENIRVAMEYASLNGLHDHLTRFIEKGKNSEDEISREWAKAYSILNDLIQKHKSYEEIKEELSQMVWNQRETKIMSKMIELYNYHNHQLYHFMGFDKDILDREIDEIDDQFMKDSFKTRIFLLYAKYYLKSNQLDKSRYYANEVIDLQLSLRHVASSQEIMGISYCLENPDTAIKYLEKAKAMYLDLAEDIVTELDNKTMVFIKNLWGMDINREIEDQAEFAHTLIRKGNNQEAQDILDSLEETPFVLFYKGLASDDNAYYWKAYRAFEERGDLFFAELPRRELVKCGELEEEAN